MSEEIAVTSTNVDDLRFRSMRVNERLGELYEYVVVFQSENIAIDLSALLGTSMTVKLETTDGYLRYFNGIVCEAEQISASNVDDLVYATYRAKIVPRPWLLGNITDCRIFKQLSTPTIVRTLLQEAGYTDLQLSLSGSYPQREYCVQYREDGLNFIQRLLQQDGIYFYFKHTETAHTMVLADGVGSHGQATDFGRVPFMPATDSVLRSSATISDWTSLRGVDGANIDLTDYNPLAPKASLAANGTSQGHGAGGIKVFDYPGTHADAERGRHFAQVRAEALSASRSCYRGSTSACSIAIGSLFQLADHPRAEWNQEYLVTGTLMELESPGFASGDGPDGPTFHCRFTALESQQPWRCLPSARKPTVVGLQTAIVTGSEQAEDIAVDEHGRVQVNFLWDLPGRPHADCSYPVRVASTWAGKGWGAVSYPRVGQEVVVSFLEGDPDRPLIVGSVYNAANTPPYALPADKTQSGIKSRSLLGGTADFNELRFEDKAGSEDFFIHAQKDMHEEVENDHVVTIDHDETAQIKHDRTHKVDNDDTLAVSNNGSTTIGKAFKLEAGTEIQLVCGQSSITLKASGEIAIQGMNISLNGTQSVKAEGGLSVDVKAGMELNLQGTMVKANADAMLTAQASGMATFKGAMVTVQGAGMTQISGGILMLG